MTCDDFKKWLFEIQGSKVSPEVAKVGNEHANICKSCGEILMGMLRKAVDKELNRGENVTKVERTDIVKESGALFYSPPDKLDQFVDPLMKPICEAINTSGWIWTAESCQGHPDATTSGTWGENTNAMIRLVTKQPGKMFECLCQAFGLARVRAERGDLFEIHGFRAYPSGRPNPGWSEILIYIDAKTTYQRDQALDVWCAFAELVISGKIVSEEDGGKTKSSN